METQPRTLVSWRNAGPVLAVTWTASRTVLPGISSNSHGPESRSTARGPTTVSASDALPPALMVALGALPGAWLRYSLVRGGTRWVRHSHWATWGVNLLACFLMGVVVGLQPRWGATSQRTLRLAVAVGFLGSLSTFSTLMAQLVALWRGSGKGEALALAGASLLGGLLACGFGLALTRG